MRVAIDPGRAFAWRWLVASLAVAFVPRADAAAPPITVAYTADATCPAAAAFLAQVRARAPQADLVDRRAGPRFSVGVRVDAKGVVGRLDMRGSDGATTSREVRGESCEGVVTALALVTALAASGDLPSADAAAEARGAAAARAPVVEPSAAEPADRAAPVAEPRSEATVWRPGVGGAFGVIGGLSPEPAAQGRAFVDLRREHTSVPLNLRLHAALAFPRTQNYPWGTAEIRVFTAGLEACPLAWSPVTGLELLPCAGFEAGPLTVQGRVNERGGTSSEATWWWADASATARAEWAVGSALRLEFQGGAVFPLTRNTYVVNNPETPIYSAPTATFALLAGAMVQFP